METTSWFNKHKVFILGGIFAIATAMVGFTAQEQVDWLVVGYAGFVGLGSYLVKNARGQWITIIGAFLGSAEMIYTSVHNHTTLNVSQLILTLAVQIALAASSPIKPVTYETSKEIVKAEITPPVEPVKPVTGTD